MSTAGQKRKNEDKAESKPKRRKYMSPPPKTSNTSTPQTPNIIYILKRNLSSSELSNQLPTSPNLAHKFILTGTSNIINFGRDPKNELILDSKRMLLFKRKQIENSVLVSRQHGKLIFNDNKWYIFDKNSTNGITVNNKKIVSNKQHLLHIGDKIIFGKDLQNTEFTYIFTTSNRPCLQPSQTSQPSQTLQPLQTSQPSQTSQTSQTSSNNMSLDAASLSALMENMTKNVLEKQQKQFELKFEQQQKEAEKLREKLREQKMKELASKEEENKRKQKELFDQQNELQRKQLETEKKQKQKEIEIALEKQKIAAQIAKQKAELQKKTNEINKITAERENKAKQKLLQLQKQQKEIEARDAKQRQLNKIEQEKFLEKEKKMISEKKKMEIKEKQIKEKETSVKKSLEEQQKSMEEECTCVMCMDLLIHTRSLQCGHTACHQCLNEWMNQQKTCPSCRQPITRDPVPTLLVDNLIQDTYLKKKSNDEKQEYKLRLQQYKVWITQKKEREEAEKRRIAAVAAAAAAAAAQAAANANRNRNMVNNNGYWGGGGGYNNRRRW